MSVSKVEGSGCWFNFDLCRDQVVHVDDPGQDYTNLYTSQHFRHTRGTDKCLTRKARYNMSVTSDDEDNLMGDMFPVSPSTHLAHLNTG